MYLYRGKEIGSREKLAETCLAIIEEGAVGTLYDIIPHIRILRAPDFFAPLVSLLKSGSNEQKAVAAHALGSLGDARSIEYLQEAHRRAISGNVEGGRLVQAAIISSLGEIPCAQSVEVLMEIHGAASHGDAFSDQQRPRLVITALGQLAQQSVDEALSVLTRLLDSSNQEIASQTLTELSLAYWHRPNELPDELANRILTIARSSESRELVMSARAALSSLAQLGSKSALNRLKELRENKKG